MSELPQDVVDSLNELGFVLSDGEEPYTLVRFMADGELRLLIQAVGGDRWRVGLAARAPDWLGRLPNPFLAAPLGRFGPSSDGTTLEVSTEALVNELPRVLDECILAVWDLPKE